MDFHNYLGEKREQSKQGMHTLRSKKQEFRPKVHWKGNRGFHMNKWEKQTAYSHIDIRVDL